VISLGSGVVGGIVGFLAVAMFAVILRRYESGRQILEEIRKLATFIVFGGLADFGVFDLLLQSSGAWVYYIIGVALVFIPLGIIVFLDWRRRDD